MKVEFVEIEDLESGGAIIKFDLDQEAVSYFARIGLEHTLISAITEDMKKHSEESNDG